MSCQHGRLMWSLSNKNHLNVVMWSYHPNVVAQRSFHPALDTWMQVKLSIKCIHQQGMDQSILGENVRRKNLPTVYQHHIYIYIMQSQGLCSFNLAPVSLALWHLQWKRAWVVQARQLQQLQPRQWCQGGKLQQPEQPLFQEHKEGSAGSSPCSCWLCFELFVAAGASWSCVWSRKNCSSLNPMNSIYFLFWSHIRGQ